MIKDKMDEVKEIKQKEKIENIEKNKFSEYLNKNSQQRKNFIKINVGKDDFISQSKNVPSSIKTNSACRGYKFSYIPYNGNKSSSSIKKK
jgi:hypothetical protein